jgi:hypothetical protein
MTSDQTLILRCLMLWVPALGVIAWRFLGKRAPGVGLTLAYSFQMWLFYFSGGLIYVLPWSDLPLPNLVALGFEQSTYAICAFAVGVVIAGKVLSKYVSIPEKQEFSKNRAFPKVYLITGVGMYLLLGTFLGRIPSLNAIIAVGQHLVVVGCCLGCWDAWQRRKPHRMILWLCVVASMPAVTVLTEGFLGHGVMALALVLLFLMTFFRPRSLLVACYILVAYFGLSFYTAYMRDRGEIRAEVWGGSPMSDRVERVDETVRNVELFSLRNPEHLEYVNGRLNQSGLVGAAVYRLSRTGEFAEGETIWQAVLGLIPRAIWPKKPLSGGSGEMVSRFTGLRFAEGTSVGIGPVMEFYANFGTWGVIIGFLVMGAILSTMDCVARDYLVRGDCQSFALYFLVGMAFVNVGGALVEISTGAIASFVLAKALKALLRTSQLPSERRRMELASLSRTRF